MISTPCASVADADVFFPDTPEQLATAQAYCAQCVVAAACLDEALANGISDGVWGGQLFERGRPVHVKRANGRPRKVAVSA